MPASRSSFTSNRSATERAPSEAAWRSSRDAGDPYRPLLRRCAAHNSRSPTSRCKAESISLAPPRCRTAASTTVSGSAVTRRPRRSTTSVSARSRRRTREPARLRPLLSRGTVTSTISGGNLVSPSQNAAASPLAAARAPKLQTAARTRAASVKGRSSTKYTPRAHCRQFPARTRLWTACLSIPHRRASASVKTPSWRRRQSFSTQKQMLAAPRTVPSAWIRRG